MSRCRDRDLRRTERRELRELQEGEHGPVPSEPPLQQLDLIHTVARAKVAHNPIAATSGSPTSVRGCTTASRKDGSRCTAACLQARLANDAAANTTTTTVASSSPRRRTRSWCS